MHYLFSLPQSYNFRHLNGFNEWIIPVCTVSNGGLSNICKIIICLISVVLPLVPPLGTYYCDYSTPLFGFALLVQNFVDDSLLLERSCLSAKVTSTHARKHTIAVLLVCRILLLTIFDNVNTSLQLYFWLIMISFDARHILMRKTGVSF